MTKTGIIKNTILIILITLLCRVLGFIREMAYASYLGTSAEADAFFVAFTIPNLLISILAFNAVSAAIIPITSKYIVGNDYKALNSFTNSLMNISFIGLSLITFLAFLLVDYIYLMIAPGFDINTKELSIGFLRIMLPTIVLLGLSSVLQALLNANKHFLYPPLSNVAFNLIVIILPIAFIGSFGINIFAYSILLGTFILFLVQYSKIKDFGYRFVFNIDYKNKDVQLVFKLLFPVMLGTIVDQINIVIGKSVASGLASGSIAALHYADKVLKLPKGVLLGAIVTTTFPSIAQYVDQGDRAALKNIVNKTLGSIFVLFTLASIVLIFVSEPIINILFQRNNFTRYDTILTAGALSYYAIGLPGMGISSVVTKTFQGFKDVRTPVLVGFFTVALNIVLTILLSQYLRHSGIALAASISLIINAAVLYNLLVKKHPFLKHSIPIALLVKFISIVLFLSFISNRYSVLYSQYLSEFNITIKTTSFFVFSLIISVMYYYLLKIANIGLVYEVERIFVGKLRKLNEKYFHIGGKNG